MTGIDPATYLRATPPFDQLARPAFEDAASALDVVYQPAGAHLVRVGGEPLAHLYVIRKGAVRLERDGQTIQLLEEGEIFGYTSLMTGRATLDAVVEEELVAYRIPAAQFRRLLSDASFAKHFAHGLAERLRGSLEQSPAATFPSDLAQEVGRLVRRPPVWVEATHTVAEAARVMRAAGVSSALVRGDPAGIVTDRDFRSRVLAAGLGPTTLVSQVASSPLRTVPSEVPIHEAWTFLLDLGVHHLALTRDGEVTGVITATDLLKTSAQGPMTVLRRVERLQSRTDLPGYGAKVAEMAASLLSGGLDVPVIAGFVAQLNDALVHRLVRWAELELGPPPAPFAWLALGSEGRQEQVLLTDQDSALVYADEAAGQRRWYEALAGKVIADLEAAGFPPCPGGHTASRWNGTLGEWVDRLDTSLRTPRPNDAALFFDFRQVAGHLDIERLEAALARASEEKLFLRFLARDALQFTPPAPFLLRLRGAGTVDIKRLGLSPVVHLARCYGLEVGSRARGTLDRLEAAHRAGLMGEDAWVTVGQAYRFLLGLRLRHQLRAVADGQVPSDEVGMASLSAIERTRLKDAFRAINRWQEKAAYHYQVTRL